MPPSAASQTPMPRIRAIPMPNIESMNTQSAQPEAVGPAAVILIVRRGAATCRDLSELA